MPRLLDEIRDSIRVRHYSIRTEEAYVRWIKSTSEAIHIFFHDKRNPREKGEREVSNFLSHWQSKREGAASTQTQALSALLFLYRLVLNNRWTAGSYRAHRKQMRPIAF